MSDPRANIEITASSTGLASGLKSAASRVHSFAGDVRGTMGKIATGGAASAIGNVVGNLASRGMDVIADQARGVMTFEKSLTRLGIAGGLNAAQLDDFRQTARKASNDVGLGADEILGAAQTYFDLTGDVAGTKNAMTSFSRIAQASGSAMSDVSTAAASMQDSMGIDASQFEAVFSGLISQGKAGAVSVKDLAGELTSLAPKFARFGGSKGPEGVIQLGAAFQVAKKGFGSASQAATGLEALMGAMSLNAKKFAAQGVRVFDVHKDGSKTFRNLHDIMTDIGKSKLATDPTLLTKAMGSKEAEATAVQLMKQKDMYDAMVVAGHDAGAVGRDLGTYLASSGGKMEVAWENVKNKIAEAMTPERIEAFAGVALKLAGYVGSIVNGIESIAKFLTDMKNAQDTEKAGKDLANKNRMMTPDQKNAESKRLRDQAAPLVAASGIIKDSWWTKVADFGTGGSVTNMRNAAKPFNGETQYNAAAELDIQAYRERKTGRDPAMGFDDSGRPGAMSSFGGAANEERTQKAMSDAIEKGFASVAKGLGIELKIGNETVAKAAAKSTDPRRGL